MQIKTGLRVYVTKPEWLLPRKQATRNAGKDVEENTVLYTADRQAHWQPVWRSVGVPQMPTNAVFLPGTLHLGLRLCCVATREEQN